MSAASVPRSEYTESIERELAFWPGVEHRFERASKHCRCVLWFGDRERFIIFPLTGSDRRGPLNNIADLRRVLREIGAVRTEAQRAPAERREHRPPPPPREVRATPGEVVEPSPHPFEPLARLQRALTSGALGKWTGVQANEERLDEAARLLIDEWHPDIIERAAEMIEQARKESA